VTTQAVLVDTSRCIGCRACMVACKEWNELPAEHVERTLPGSYQNRDDLTSQTWTVVHFAEQASGDDMRWLFAKTQCMHCADAACVSVCPTGAMQKDGTLTYLDETKCIGEGYCVAACPFGAVALDEGKGIVQKCTLCIDRVEHGELPACVKACPADALEFGDRAQMVAVAEARVGTLKGRGLARARTYGVDELGGLGYVYVLQDDPSVYQLPERPSARPVDIPVQARDWVAGAAAFGLGAIPVWWVFRRRTRLASEAAEREGEVR